MNNVTTNAGKLPVADRYVSLEVPNSGGYYPSGPSSLDHLDENGHYRPRCFACCAWACFTLFLIIVVFLFTGISYLGFLQSGMPKVNVRALNITKLEINENMMNSDISMTLRVTNDNDKLVLLYSTLSVLVTSKRVTLGETKIVGFSQMPKNETDFEMNMVQNNVNVDKFAVDALKSDIYYKDVVYDVYIQGKIGLKVGNLMMNNVPFLAACQQITQRDVDLGRRPACNAKMFGSRPSNN